MSSPFDPPAWETSRSVKRWLIPVLAAVVLVVGGVVALMVWLSANLPPADFPQVGSCFEASAISPQISQSPSATVDCADPKAAYKVIGIVENKTADEFDPDVDCAGWQTARAGVWLGREGQAGTVYCVETVKRGT